ncbi:DUF3788 family protein [bacterium]|nr:DUF3788 family protein [bacterium]
MEQPVLGDKNTFPADKVVFSHIGKSKPLWISVFDSLHAHHPDILTEWRYYNDGKSWLLKATRKKKTIFWLSVIPGSFRMTFYLNDSAQEAVMNSALSDELKEQFRSGKKYGKIRGLTVLFRNKKDVEYAGILIRIKLSVK